MISGLGEGGRGSGHNWARYRLGIAILKSSRYRAGGVKIVSYQNRPRHVLESRDRIRIVPDMFWNLEIVSESSQTCFGISISYREVKTPYRTTLLLIWTIPINV